MSHGGARIGAGRKKGQKASRTIEREQRMREVAKVLESTLPNAFKGEAHDLLMAIYKDQDLPLPLRLNAAVAAIGYEKPKLQAVTHSGDADNPLETSARVELVIIDARDDPGLCASETGTTAEACQV